MMISEDRPQTKMLWLGCVSSAGFHVGTRGTRTTCTCVVPLEQGIIIIKEKEKKTCRRKKCRLMRNAHHLVLSVKLPIRGGVFCSSSLFHSP